MLARRTVKTIFALVVATTAGGCAADFASRFAGETADSYSIVTVPECTRYAPPLVKAYFGEPDEATHCDGTPYVLKDGFKYFSECEAFRRKHVAAHFDEFGRTACGASID